MLPGCPLSGVQAHGVCQQVEDEHALREAEDAAAARGQEQLREGHPVRHEVAARLLGKLADNNVECLDAIIRAGAIELLVEQLRDGNDATQAAAAHALRWSNG